MARYSKATYIEIATVLRLLFQKYSDSDDVPQEEVIHSLADMFAADNPAFDRGRFISATRDQRHRQAASIVIIPMEERS